MTNTTVNPFRLEIVGAFDIQSLEEHVEKMKNGFFRNNKLLVHRDQMSRAPLGWNDGIDIQGLEEHEKKSKA